MLEKISVYIIPFIFMGIVTYALYKKVNIFEAFLKGAKDGLNTVFNIIPALIGLICAITMLRVSGALDFLINLISPFTDMLNIPSEVMPLALLRPVSGSGALAVVSDILKEYGPDSQIGRIASVMMGSTETTFYTLCVYFGSVGITDSRYSLPAALSADVFGFLASVVVCNMFYC